MKEGLSHDTMRQMRAQFSQPRLWAVLVGIGIVLALAGAFGTGGILRPVPLALYWIGVVIVTFAAGSVVSIALVRMIDPWPLPARVLVLGLCNGVAVCAVILGINTALFGLFLDSWAEALTFCGSVFAVTLVISAVLEVLERPSDTAAGAPQTPQAEAQAQAQAPALLDRLPFDKRGGLVALSVEDHYVRVRTTQGEEMLLMRLSDAIKEAGDGGMQVHRSHWVALTAVASARREGDRAVLTMTTGPDVPVSRRYVPGLKAAGLL